MKPHTFSDWYKVHNPRKWHWFRVRATYRELGFRYFGLTPWRMLSFTGFAPELVYYLKCRFWRKYNVVKVRSLPPTWVDRDRLLLHAAFQILCDVVEKEDWLARQVYFLPVTEKDLFGWDGRDDWQEVATLYDWWMNKRPAWEKAEEEALTSNPSKFYDMQKAGDQDDEDMLIRLCRIRPHLWT